MKLIRFADFRFWLKAAHMWWGHSNPTGYNWKNKLFRLTGGGNTKTSPLCPHTPLYLLAPLCLSHLVKLHSLILILCLSQGMEYAKKVEAFPQVLVCVFLMIRVSSLQLVYGVLCALTAMKNKLVIETQLQSWLPRVKGTHHVNEGSYHEIPGKHK